MATVGVKELKKRRKS